MRGGVSADTEQLADLFTKATSRAGERCSSISHDESRMQTIRKREKSQSDSTLLINSHVNCKSNNNRTTTSIALRTYTRSTLRQRALYVYAHRALLKQ